MVVTHGKVIHGADDDLAVFNHGPVFGGMHTQNSRLRRVDDGGGQHRTKRAAIADGEGSASHFFNAQFSVSRLGTIFSDFFLDVSKTHLIGIAQDGHDQTTRAAHRNTDVKVAVVDNVSAIDRCVDDREFFERVNRCLHKKAHEADLDAMLFFEFFLESLAHFHHGSHVHFVEGGQDGIGRLRLKQTLRDTST